MSLCSGAEDPELIDAGGSIGRPVGWKPLDSPQTTGRKSGRGWQHDAAVSEHQCRPPRFPGSEKAMKQWFDLWSIGVMAEKGRKCVCFPHPLSRKDHGEYHVNLCLFTLLKPLVQDAYLIRTWLCRESWSWTLGVWTGRARTRLCCAGNDKLCLVRDATGLHFSCGSW